MAEIPYMSAPGSIVKILEKIKEASAPEIFSQDFLKTKLGFNGGNYLTFISWAKKCGLLNSDGTPSQLYRQFRNPATSAQSLAIALKQGYSELYSRNEYCHELERKAFKALVMDATGDSHDSRKVDMIVGTFFNVKTLADFDQKEAHQSINIEKTESKNIESQIPNATHSSKKVALGLNYTINLVLPKTDDPAVFNAIFKSLRDNLLND